MAVFTGTTIEEAKEKARTQLKPTVNQTIEFAVLQQPQHGFLGIGRRQGKQGSLLRCCWGRRRKTGIGRSR